MTYQQLQRREGGLVTLLIVVTILTFAAVLWLGWEREPHDSDQLYRRVIGWKGIPYYVPVE